MAKKSTIKRWKQYSKISGVGSITRRYFVMNAFDGALTMLGVVIGAAVGGIIEQYGVIISAGVAGSIAMGASGISGAYMTEKAARTKKIKTLEKAMLTDLEKKGIHHKSHQFATFFAAIVDGFSPALAAMVVISPFFFVGFGIPPETAFYTSIGITLTVLVLLGIYLAKISDESMIKYGIQMLIVGLITAGLCIGTSILLGGNLAV